MAYNDLVRPMYLVEGRNVRLIDDDKKLNGFALVEFNEKEKQYTIRINRKNVYELYTLSWLKKDVQFETFMNGIKLHEISHILYESFSIPSVTNNGVFKFILNTLLDSQCEYSLTRDHPSVSYHIHVILSALKRDTEISRQTEKVKEIQKNVKDLFWLVRFGIVMPDADSDFISFCLPLILSSTRNDARNVAMATNAIYEYLLIDSDDQTMDAVDNSKEKSTAITEQDLIAAEEGEQIANSMMKDFVDQTRNPSSKALKGNTALVIKDEESPFFRATVLKHATLISKVRVAFMHRFDELQQTAAYEGELLYGRQQQAYVDSFTGDSNLNYYVYKKREISIDVAILRDVSGSTKEDKIQYGELTVVILTAISGIAGLRVSQIDFSDTAIVNLGFNEEVRESRLQPVADGGTQLLEAYKKVEEFQWKAKKRLCIVVTDGYIADSSLCAKKENHLKRVLNIEVSKWHISEQGKSNRTGLISTTFNSFHTDILKYLLGRI
jgi:hypothetical protein